MNDFAYTMMKKTIQIFLAATIVMLSAGNITIAQDNLTRSTRISEQFREAMIDGSKQMYEIATSIKTVEQAKAAKPQVRDMIDNMIAIFEESSRQLDTMSLQEMYDLRIMRRIFDDPEFVQWREKADAALYELEERHPEAAVIMWEAGTDYDSRLLETATRLLVGFDTVPVIPAKEPHYSKDQVVEEYRGVLQNLCQEMVGVVNGIKRRKDVDNAESIVEQSIEEMKDSLWDLIEKVEHLSLADRKSIGRAFKSTMEHPSIATCSEEARTALADLERRNPKAREDFEELNEEYAEEFNDAVEDIVEFLIELEEE